MVYYNNRFMESNTNTNIYIYLRAMVVVYGVTSPQAYVDGRLLLTQLLTSTGPESINKGFQHYNNVGSEHAPPHLIR